MTDMVNRHPANAQLVCKPTSFHMSLCIGDCKPYRLDIASWNLTLKSVEMDAFLIEFP